MVVVVVVVVVVVIFIVVIFIVVVVIRVSFWSLLFVRLFLGELGSVCCQLDCGRTYCLFLVACLSLFVAVVFAVCCLFLCLLFCVFSIAVIENINAVTGDVKSRTLPDALM